MSRSQRNIYNGVLRDDDPHLYLIGRRYRFEPIGQAEFLAALRKTILANPIQLCVLADRTGADRYPDLVPRLRVDDIVHLSSADEPAPLWTSGILEQPLVRHTVEVDSNGLVQGLEIQAHHILLDGGAIGIIEAHLGRHLRTDSADDIDCAGGPSTNLTDVAAAHRREASRIDESHGRLSDAVRRELTTDAGHGGPQYRADTVPGMAAKGIRIGSVVIRGSDYDRIADLADREQIALNVLVAAAATAVDASVRQTTASLLVHAVDNRFGDPALEVATCLVNSIAQPVRFPAFASVADVVRTMDRGYVRAGRRRWLREEHYRRMYLALQRTTAVEAVTLNFLRAPCAPELRPYLVDTPATTEIGPVEGMTVAAILDESARTLTLDIWDRADAPQAAAATPGRIAQALTSMPQMWDRPLAMIVDDWRVIADGATCPPAAPAWFLARDGVIAECRRRHVDPWISWLLHHGARPGDVVVFTDDNTDRTTALIIACHLAGCGYSVCDDPEQFASRVERITAQAGDIAAHVLDITSANLQAPLDAARRRLVDARIAQVRADPLLSTRIAYVMPTSGSTGEPKLVRVNHGSLAMFCAAQVRAYGWGPEDTVLQCAPLTSDISVEEIFGAALSGATLVRSTAVKTGDLPALNRDLVTSSATIVDLPTAVWHLWCDVGETRLRQIVIGGEPVRPDAVDRWLDTAAAEGISLISSYGPTEATVVVTYLPIIDDGRVIEHDARRRLGRPLVADTVVVAFGEVVVIGDLVADGYLGAASPSFGTVTLADGAQRRAYATADRVIVDDAGCAVFAGRKDAVVKVAGKRVDTAEVTRRVAAQPGVYDVAVHPHNGSLGVWFAGRPNADGGAGMDVSERIKDILVGARVPSFFVTAVASIPRAPSGKIDTARLCALVPTGDTGPNDPEFAEQAADLAVVWGRHLGRPIAPHTSLLREGVGSLDLVRILPETRRRLGREISILDLISADTAANLVGESATADRPRADAAAIERDLIAVSTPRRPARQGPVLVLGASGIVGTGVAEAILEFAESGRQIPEVVFASRSFPPGGIWSRLRHTPGVRIENLSAGFDASEVAALIRRTGAGTLVNCAGNTNAVLPYREIRGVNLELVSAIADACAATSTRLVHLSTYVVSADVFAPTVVDPRQAPYPYAASKALAELAVAGAPGELDFTIVRLPRILGTAGQVRAGADILVSLADACAALHAYPAVELTEQVTTGHAAARAVLGRLPEFGGPPRLGRKIDVLCAPPVSYPELLGAFGAEPLAAPDWKQRLDRSEWARANPGRWSVIDAWISLGTMLGGRSYPEYLASYPALPLEIDSVDTLTAIPPSIQELIAPSERPINRRCPRQ
ncbi:AMP-binding protein [Mycobacterium sp. TNTM28]|uniref:AMP-binding protein n=1 Tax=[Mycobacterium] fortunisiensis TaxID=2600579 RepID=A0ABS6KQP6_9MYCO|nr:AMP-binding protein [[Mycobacterium] fortunisiensis]